MKQAPFAKTASIHKDSGEGRSRIIRPGHITVNNRTCRKHLYGGADYLDPDGKS